MRFVRGSIPPFMSLNSSTMREASSRALLIAVFMRFSFLETRSALLLPHWLEGACLLASPHSYGRLHFYQFQSFKHATFPKEPSRCSSSPEQHVADLTYHACITYRPILTSPSTWFHDFKQLE